jgi:hypothetical protein
MKCSYCLKSNFQDWFDYQSHITACRITPRIYKPMDLKNKEIIVLRGEEQFKEHIIDGRKDN